MSAQAPWRIDLVTRGLRLRTRGLTYSAIAVVLDEYHDFRTTEGSVRGMLRRHGAAPAPRGASTANLRRGTRPA